MGENSNLENLLRSVYYDLKSPAAYAGLPAIYNEAKKRDRKIKLSDVKNFLQKEFAYTLHRPQRKKFRRLATVPNGLHTDWQCDLCVFDRLKEHNQNNPYALTCMDVLSRKLFAQPVKSKKPEAMQDAFDRIFATNKGILPHKIYTDRGLEFEASSMKDYFQRKGIQKRVIYTPGIHCAVVERANRTLKGRIYRYFSKNNTLNWIEPLQKIVNSINESKNRTTGLAPNQVTFANANELWNKLYKDINNFKGKAKYKIGDIVRVSKAKGLFDKGYLASYSDRLYRIKYVDNSQKPVTYRIEDLEGNQQKGIFYTEELVLASENTAYRIAEVLKERTRKGVKELFVSWVGFDDTHNSWIKETDLV